MMRSQQDDFEPLANLKINKLVQYSEYVAAVVTKRGWLDARLWKDKVLFMYKYSAMQVPYMYCTSAHSRLQDTCTIIFSTKIYFTNKYKY